MTEMSKTRIVKRRFLTAEQKMILVHESYEPMKTVAEIARKYDIGVSSLVKWRTKALNGGLMSVNDTGPVMSHTEAKKLKKENKKLQQLLGKKMMQIEILQEMIALGREKKLISPLRSPGEDNSLFE